MCNLLLLLLFAGLPTVALAEEPQHYFSRVLTIGFDRADSGSGHTFLEVTSTNTQAKCQEMLAALPAEHKKCWVGQEIDPFDNQSFGSKLQPFFGKQPDHELFYIHYKDAQQQPAVIIAVEDGLVVSDENARGLAAALQQQGAQNVEPVFPKPKS